MRTCLSLTPELQEFYEQLTGQNKPDEEVDEEDSDDYDQEQEPENSLQPKKRNTRNIVSTPFKSLKFSSFIQNILAILQRHHRKVFADSFSPRSTTNRHH